MKASVGRLSLTKLHLKNRRFGLYFPQKKNERLVVKVQYLVISYDWTPSSFGSSFCQNWEGFTPWKVEKNM